MDHVPTVRAKLADSTDSLDGQTRSYSSTIADFLDEPEESIVYENHTRVTSALSDTSMEDFDEWCSNRAESGTSSLHSERKSTAPSVEDELWPTTPEEVSIADQSRRAETPETSPDPNRAEYEKLLRECETLRNANLTLRTRVVELGDREEALRRELNDVREMRDLYDLERRVLATEKERLKREAAQMKDQMAEKDSEMNTMKKAIVDIKQVLIGVRAFYESRRQTRDDGANVKNTCPM
jgi:predicted  nucleic acid-binding Zn-ribbon protein